MIDLEALRAAYAPAPVGVRVNFVSSVDGAVTVDGQAGGLSSPTDQRLLVLLRTLCDVLVVGAGTVRAEEYAGLGIDAEARAWRRANGLSDHPRFAIVSSRLDLDPDHPSLGAAPEPVLLLTHAGAPAEARRRLGSVAEIVDCGTTAVDFRLMAAELAARGLRRVLSEGGPTVFAALIAAGLVDELCLTLSPVLAGPGPDRITAGVPTPVQPLDLRHVLVDDDHLFLRYARPGDRDQ